MSKQNLQGLTVVITGASSGNGKAIALTLAKQKVNLVLAARREAFLQEVASECESFGGNAIAVKTDVTDFEQVKNLAATANVQFGSIDVWINNAGVGAVGEFTETPLEAHEQVIKTNLMSYLYGCYAVLPYFKGMEKGHIINMASVGAFVAAPYAAAYSASKFGLKGLSEALQAELTRYPDIHLSVVSPAFVDTPGPQHAANFTGKFLKPAPPIYDPFKVAYEVKKLIEKPKRNVLVGSSAYLARAAQAVSPALLGKFMARFLENYFKNAKPAVNTMGNLLTPVLKGTRAHGGWLTTPSVWKYYFKKKYLVLH